MFSRPGRTVGDRGPSVRLHGVEGWIRAPRAAEAGSGRPGHTEGPRDAVTGRRPGVAGVTASTPYPRRILPGSEHRRPPRPLGSRRSPTRCPGGLWLVPGPSTLRAAARRADARFEVGLQPPRDVPRAGSTGRHLGRGAPNGGGFLVPQLLQEHSGHSSDTARRPTRPR